MFHTAFFITKDILVKPYREIAPQDLRDNPFKLIGTDWMLITAGTQESFNTMTAWGGLGVAVER